MAGNATFSGTEYQAGVMAYVAVHILLEQRLGWFEFLDDTPTGISGETGGAGDDAAVELRAGLPTFEIQAKHGLDSTAEFIAIVDRIASFPEREGRPSPVVLAIDRTASRWLSSSVASDLDARRSGREDTSRAKTREILAALKSPERIAALQRLHIKLVNVDALSDSEAKWAVANLAHALREPDRATTAWLLLRDDAAELCKKRERRRRVDLIRFLEAHQLLLNPPAPIAQVNAALDQSRLLLKNFKAQAVLALLADIDKQVKTIEVDGPTRYRVLQQRAASYLQLDRPKDALEFARRALDHLPNGTRALSTAALASLALGDTQQALEYTEQATTADPDDGDAWAVRAQVNTSAGQPIPTPSARAATTLEYRTGLVHVLLNVGNVGEVMDLSATLMQEGHRTADILVARATALLSTPDGGIAVGSERVAAEIERLTTEAIEEADPSDYTLGHALLARAMARRALNRHEDANDDIQQAQDLQPHDPAPILEGAQVRMVDGDFEGARRLLSRPVVERFPILIALRAEAVAHLADSDGARRDIDESLRRLSEAHDPNAVRMAAANAALELRDVDLAERILAAISGPATDTARYFIVRGRLAFVKDDIEQMIADFTQAATREEKFRRLCYAELGSRLLTRKRYKEAVDAFGKSDPMPAKVREQYVRALGAAGQLVEANRLIEEELAKEHDAPNWALALAAQIALVREDRERAIEHLTRLHERNDATPAARLQLASVLIQVDRKKDARLVVDALVRDADTLSPIEQMGVARALFWIGERDQAIARAFKAYRSADDDPELHQALATLVLTASPPVQPVEVVGPDTYVRLRNPSSGDEKEYVVMADEPINAAAKQISMPAAEALNLIGLKVGDRTQLKDWLSTWEVVELKQALHHVVQDIVGRYEDRFPNEPVFVKGFKVSEGLTKVSDFAPMIMVLHQGEERRKTLVELYRKQMLPLGILAAQQHATIGEAMAYLRSEAGGTELFVEWADLEGQRRSIAVASEYRDLVLTDSALETSRHLGLLDVLTQRFSLFAPRSLRSSIEAKLAELQRMVERGHTVMTTAGPGLQMHQWEAGHPTLVSARDELRTLLDWLDGHARFEPRPLASIETVSGDDSAREVIGHSSYDSSALAVDRSIPMYADDLGLRRLGLADGVLSFSTPSLLIALAESGALDLDTAYVALLKLVEMRYVRIPLSLELLKRLVRSMSGAMRLHVLAANLAPPAFTPQTAGRLGAQLLKWVATEPILPDSVAGVTSLLLSAMSRYWTEALCAQALLRAAVDEFSLLPGAIAIVRQTCVDFAKSGSNLRLSQT